MTLNKVCWFFLFTVYLGPIGIETQSQTNTTGVGGKNEQKTLYIDLKLTLEIPLKNASTVNATISGIDGNKSGGTDKTNESKEDTDELKESSEEEDEEKVIEDTTPIEDHPSWRIVENPDFPCGESVSKRVVGGLNAGLGHHPWVARLGRYKYFNGQYKGVVNWYCGGAVINIQYVLTAAHCTSDPDFKVIRLGEYDSNAAKDCNMFECSDIPQDFTPQHIVTHPKFVTTVAITPHDIALVRLNSRIDFNGWVAPVCLPRSNIPALNKGMAEVIGWGKTTSDKQSSTAVLQSVKLPIVGGSRCMDGFFDAPNAGTFCAGGKRKEDSCCGDSGGPLLKKQRIDGTMRHYIIGIVSFGPKKCGNGVPAAYTNVSYHMRWLLDSVEPYYL